MVLQTPFTRAFGLSVPVCLAPMDGVSGGRLAAAVARGGGLGVIGAGSGKSVDMLDEEVRIFREEAPVGAKLAIGLVSWAALGGCGYGITQAALRPSLALNGSRPNSTGSVGSTGTWGSVADGVYGQEGINGVGLEAAREACSTEPLQELLDRYKPSAIWLFAPATPCKEAYTMCQEMGVDVIAQVGTVAEARTAVEMGASVVVAQGREAGGHGLRPDLARGTLPLAAAVAVELAETGRPVLAAGGVVSGRGLLAALALGCDGVVMGTRYCATYEALGSDEHKAKLVSTSGDETVRTRVFDMASAARPIEPIEWPEPYDSSGVARNAFTSRWHTHEEQLEKELSARDPLTGYSAPTTQLEEAERCRDLSLVKVFMGEGAGLIYSVDSAEKITRDVAKEAEDQLDRLNNLQQSRHFDPVGTAAHPRADSTVGHSPVPEDKPVHLDATPEDVVRHRRAYTVGAAVATLGRAPGTRQVISSGSAYEKMAGYSRAVRVGNQVQVAGTTATNPDGSGVLCAGDVAGQTQYIFHIIALALREAGCSLENVVRTRMFVTDIANAGKVMAEHCKVFANIRPAATLVMVSALVHPELLVEIEADAVEP